MGIGEPTVAVLARLESWADFFAEKKTLEDNSYAVHWGPNHLTLLAPQIRAL